MERPSIKTGEMSAKREHVDRLIEQFGLVVLWAANENECAADEGIVFIEPVECDVSYLIALHEIGHSQTRKKQGILNDERLAWEWVMDNIEEAVDRDAWAYGLWHLGIYLCDQVIEEQIEGTGSLPDQRFFDTYGRMSWRAGDNPEAIPPPEKVVAMMALVSMPDFADYARKKWKEHQDEEKKAA